MSCITQQTSALGTNSPLGSIPVSFPKKLCLERIFHYILKDIEENYLKLTFIMLCLGFKDTAKEWPV